MRGGSVAQLVLALLHTICERNPKNEDETFRMVHVSCSCLQNHTISPWGFMLLEEVETSLGSREESMLAIDTVGTVLYLQGPFLMALASKVACQEVSVKKQGIYRFVCEL